MGFHVDKYANRPMDPMCGNMVCIETSGLGKVSDREFQERNAYLELQQKSCDDSWPSKFFFGDFASFALHFEL